MAEPALAPAPRERKERPQRPPPPRLVLPTRAPAGIPPPVGRLPVAPGPGEPLRPSVAARVGSGLGVDVSGVRVHSDSAAASAAASLDARAFTLGNRVFLGSGERPTDLPLMAHEVAHVVQQQGAPALQRWSRGGADLHEREAQRAAAAVVRGERFQVRERTPPRVQRLGISDALDYFADKANLIPGFRMFTIILGVNPINMSRVERSAANILRAVIEFIPGGGLITQALDGYGIFDRVGTWIEEQIRTLGMTGSVFREAINRFLDSLSWSDIFHLGDVWERAKRIFTEPIRRIVDFLGGLVSGIVRFIKDAILRPLARLAEGTRGYDLLKAVLGEDPITGEPVPRTAETLIGGFMKLIGQEEVWENIKRANAIARAWAWFQGALAGLLGFVRAIPGMFISALQSLELADIVLLPRAFMKVGRVFLGFLGEFLSWAGRQVLSLLQIIFEVLAPAVMPYLRKAMGAFRTIIENPIRFIGHLVRAGIQGFRQFADNFLNHLRRSLIEWLTGTLSGAGIYIPQAFELREIVKFVLSVLGLTWQNIRSKLVRVIGEPAVTALETVFDIVVTLVREGPAAAWEKIREQLTNLREMVMEQIMTFVRERIVQAAITRLVTSLNPAGAFIQAIIAIYNTVMFFVERLRQIAQVAMSFIDSIAAIASGAIGQAANRVEQTMAGLLTLVISFLARLVGLGRVSDAVVNIVNRIRAPIDRALDFVVNWIVNAARAIGRLVAQAGVPQDPNERLRLGVQAAIAAANRFAGRRVGAAVLTPLLAAIRVRYGFQTLEVFQRGERWWVRGRVNPDQEGQTEAGVGEPGAAADAAFGSREKPFQIRWHKPPLANYPTISLTVDVETGERRDVKPTDSVEIRYAMENEAARARLAPIRGRISSLAGRIRTREGIGPIYDPARRQAFERQVARLRETAEAELEDARAALQEFTQKSPEERRADLRQGVGKGVLGRAVRSLEGAVRDLTRAQEIPELERQRVEARAEADATWQELKALRIYDARTDRIGVAAANRTARDSVLGPRIRRPSTPEQTRFRTVLREAGYGWPGTEADHVTEATLSGPDHFSNLWPLAENVTPDQIINPDSGLEVGLPNSGGTGRHYNDGFFLGKFFKIVGFKR